MKPWWCLVILAIVVLSAGASVLEPELWEEDDKEVLLVRSARGIKERGASGSGSGGANSPPCRYTKGQWSECDPKNNMRTRTLTLIKKSDQMCEQTKIITKKCKKACRYEKGTWSNCINQNMTRIDNLKVNSDSTCEKTRRMTKKCKLETNTKKATKDRSKKASKQQ